MSTPDCRSLVALVLCLASGYSVSLADEPVKGPREPKKHPGTIEFDLPAAGDARVLEVELRLNDQGQLLGKDKAPLSPAETKKYLHDLYSAARKQATTEKKRAEDIRAVIWCPEEKTPAARIQEVQQLARDAGFGTVEFVREPVLAAEVDVLLRVAKDGSVAGVVVTRKGQKPVTLPAEKWEAALLKHLQGLRKDLKNQDDIQISAESKLKYTFVIDALDTCTRAGFTRVGFAPPPDLEGNKP